MPVPERVDQLPRPRRRDAVISDQAIYSVVEVAWREGRGPAAADSMIDRACAGIHRGLVMMPAVPVRTAVGEHVADTGVRVRDNDLGTQRGKAGRLLVQLAHQARIESRHRRGERKVVVDDGMRGDAPDDRCHAGCPLHDPGHAGLRQIVAVVDRNQHADGDDDSQRAPERGLAGAENLPFVGRLQRPHGYVVNEYRAADEYDGGIEVADDDREDAVVLGSCCGVEERSEQLVQKDA